MSCIGNIQYIIVSLVRDCIIDTEQPMVSETQHIITERLDVLLDLSRSYARNSSNCICTVNSMLPLYSELHAVSVQ